MSTKPAVDPAAEQDVLDAIEPLHRVVSARVADPDLADDIVQETLARLWEARWRLDRPALLAYGIVVARNLVVSHDRSQEVARRHAPRLGDPLLAPSPEESALELEEQAAVSAALGQLSETDQSLLLGHEVEGIGTGKLAAEQGTSSAALAARLARARARLRVHHVLTMRRTELPTPACRGVLEAISLGDQRRQRDLRAGAHLLDCRTCAELSQPLLHRSRSMTALIPVGWLLAVWQWVVRSAKAHPVGTAASTGVVALAGVALGFALHQPAPSGTAAPPSPSPSPTRSPTPTATPSAPAPLASLRVSGAQLLPAPQQLRLGDYVGRRATGVHLRVLSVPADEGFWVGSSATDRVWAS